MADTEINPVSEKTNSDTNQQYEEPQYPTGFRLVIVMTSLMLGTFLMALDSTIISVATPRISTDFHALDDVGWYGAAYGLTLCAFTPVFSNFYKHFDPKIVYLTVIIIFEVGSVICAAAPTSPAFIVGRAISGIGAAGFASSNLPIGGAVFVLVVIFMKLVGVDPAPRQLPLKEKLRKLDAPGVLLLIASVVCLFLALQVGGNEVPWSNSKPIGLLVGSVLIGILFGLWQWKAGENATIPLRFFQNRTVIWGSLYLLWDNMANYIAIYYMPFFFQAGQGSDPIRSGVQYVSLAAPLMVGLLAGGGITTVTGQYMPVILFAQVLAAIGSGLLTTVRTSTTTVEWATYMALTGAGLGLGVNVPHIAIQAVFESDNDIFVANGIASFFGQLGGSIGVPAGNAVLIAALRKQVPKNAPGIDTQTVIDMGPLNLENLTKSSSILHGLREAWSIAVSDVNILLVSIICISIPTALGMQWLNVKKIFEEREAKRLNSTNQNDSSKLATP